MNSKSTVIKNVNILTMNQNKDIIENGMVIYKDDKIVYVGCEKEFDEESLQNLKETAQSYSETELQNGDVRLNEYISLKGEIVESDSRSSLIKKGDRFILKSGSSKYQVFNEQKKKLKIGDEVTVYGEYYGFLKGTLIESEENHDSATN